MYPFNFTVTVMLVGVCDEDELMLMQAQGSNDASRGILLVCENEEFVGVCSGGFNTRESRAACRQLDRSYVDGGKLL